MTEYRLLAAEEYPAAVELWTRVFAGVEAGFFTSLLDGGQPEDNISIAALEDSVIVSSVHVFIRKIRDRSGTPMKVGGIGSVSTHPDHRKKGHSGRLLEMAIEEMEKAGCLWSYLGTGVNDHYARYGWKTISTSFPSGLIRPALSGGGDPLQPDDATLTAMASLYAPFTVTRPMAAVRDEQTWRTAIRFRIDPKRVTSLGAWAGGRLVAYVVVHNSWGAWSIADAAYAPGAEDHVPGLFAAAAHAAQAKGADRLHSTLPSEPVLDAAFASIVVEPIPGEARGMMARPIADRISWPNLAALLADPAGRYGPLDAF